MPCGGSRAAQWAKCTHALCDCVPPGSRIVERGCGTGVRLPFSSPRVRNRRSDHCFTAAGCTKALPWPEPSAPQAFCVSGELPATSGAFASRAYALTGRTPFPAQPPKHRFSAAVAGVGFASRRRQVATGGEKTQPKRQQLHTLHAAVRRPLGRDVRWCGGLPLLHHLDTDLQVCGHAGGPRAVRQLQDDRRTLVQAMFHPLPVRFRPQLLALFISEFQPCRSAHCAFSSRPPAAHASQHEHRGAD